MLVFNQSSGFTFLNTHPLQQQPEGLEFLSTQTFQEELDDGSIIFTLEYTQPLEILTLIQRWLPDLVILEPQELRDEYLEKLESTIKNHKGELDG